MSHTYRALRVCSPHTLTSELDLIREVSLANGYKEETFNRLLMKARENVRPQQQEERSMDQCVGKKATLCLPYDAKLHA